MLKRMRTEWVEIRHLPEEEFSVEALQAIWAREEEEATARSIREAEERKAMAIAEKEIKDFNAWELKVNLDTRRYAACHADFRKHIKKTVGYLFLWLPMHNRVHCSLLLCLYPNFFWCHWCLCSRTGPWQGRKRICAT